MQQTKLKMIDNRQTNLTVIGNRVIELKYCCKSTG